MLKHKYGDAYENPSHADPENQTARQNLMLAKHHPTDALQTLKEQLTAYSKGSAPFNRRLRPKKENTADWWRAVQKDDASLKTNFYYMALETCYKLCNGRQESHYGN